MPSDVLEIGADEAVGIDTVLEAFVHHPAPSDLTAPLKPLGGRNA